MTDVTATAASTGQGPPTGLEFEVIGAEPMEHSAAPGVRFRLRLTEPQGREIYTIALSTQIMIDPARRTYDDETRERLVELFGAPERWSATTHQFQWAQVEALVPSFTTSTEFTLQVPCTFDMEVTAAKYFYSLPDGEAPLSFHFNGTVMYAGEHERLQVILVPWSCSARWRMPIEVWKQTIANHYPAGTWIRLGEDTLAALGRDKAAHGDYSFDAAVHRLLGERAG